MIYIYIRLREIYSSGPGSPAAIVPGSPASFVPGSPANLVPGSPANLVPGSPDCLLSGSSNCFTTYTSAGVIHGSPFDFVTSVSGI